MQDKDFAIALFLIFYGKYSKENYSSKGKSIWVLQYFVEVSKKNSREFYVKICNWMGLEYTLIIAPTNTWWNTSRWLLPFDDRWHIVKIKANGFRYGWSSLCVSFFPFISVNASFTKVVERKERKHQFIRKNCWSVT